MRHCWQFCSHPLSWVEWQKTKFPWAKTKQPRSKHHMAKTSKPPGKGDFEDARDHNPTYTRDLDAGSERDCNNFLAQIDMEYNNIMNHPGHLGSQVLLSLTFQWVLLGHLFAIVLLIPTSCFLLSYCVTTLPLLYFSQCTIGWSSVIPPVCYRIYQSTVKFIRVLLYLSEYCFQQLLLPLLGGSGAVLVWCSADTLNGRFFWYIVPDTTANMPFTCSLLQMEACKSTYFF